MFHYKDKLKELSVELKGDTYTIEYIDEKVVVEINTIDIHLSQYTKSHAGIHKPKKRAVTAHHIVVGKANLKRDVYHFTKPGGLLPTLRCGLTVHKGANTWSSTPHPFEENPEPGFEEAFLYLLNDGIFIRSTAIQLGRGMWYDGEFAFTQWQVHNRDISAIPMGYHPVVGEPGVKVAYIWAYLAKKDEWEKI